MRSYLDFEKPVAELEAKVEELRAIQASGDAVALTEEISRLETKAGQAEAIARSTQACLSLRVPNIAVVLGEGGSGGAIAIATANRVLMLEHAIYSVISPEGAASILWRDTSKAQDAATNMKITAQDLLRFGVIDAIVPEPVGGAHRAPEQAINSTGDYLENALKDLSSLSREAVRQERRQKFLA